MYTRTIWIIFLLLFLTDRGIPNTRVVGYYPSWLVSSMNPEALDFSILTHVNHVFAWPSEDGEIITSMGMFDLDINISVHENGGYILLGFGGWGNSDGFGPMVSSPETRATFIDNVIETCQYYEYDGIDLDWEHPQTSAETANYTLLVQELREATTAEFDDFLISMAIPTSNWSGQHYDLTDLAPHIDWFNAMTYDYHGSWTTHAGHNAPLYPSPANDPDGSCHTSINYLLNNRHLDPDQVNMGLAFYGKEFSAASINGSSTGGHITYQYNELIGFLDQGWSYQWDTAANVPYLQNQEMTRLITYDNPESIALKCAYAAERELGGVMIWALGQDYMNGQEVLLEGVRNYVTSTDHHQPMHLSASGFHVFPNYPNPFNPETTLEYELTEPGDVSIAIYDARGSEVYRVNPGAVGVGRHQVTWDGKHSSGRSVGEGVYLARLQAGHVVKVVKMLYLD